MKIKFRSNSLSVLPIATINSVSNLHSIHENPLKIFKKIKNFSGQIFINRHKTKVFFIFKNLFKIN